MGRNKSKDKKGALEESSLSERRGLKDEAKHTIIGIILLALAVFLCLAGLKYAGPVGDYIYRSLHYLLGSGYYLVPLVSLLLSISFFKFSRPRIVSTRLLGVLLFVVSGLGLIELGFHDKTAGIIGWAVSGTATRLFGVASWLIFVVMLIISLVLFFETSFSLPNLWARIRRKREQTTDEEDLEQTQGLLDDQGTEEQEEAEAGANQNEPRKQNIVEKIFARNSGASSQIAEEFTPSSRADAAPYVPPPLELLGKDSGKPAAGDIKANSNIIKRTLANFGIEVEMDEISIGPSITRYALKPAEGVKLSKIVALQNDLSLALAAHPLRVEAPIPGKSLVGIEVPNSVKTTVRLGTILAEDDFKTSDKSLLVALGKNIAGTVQFADLAKMPHLLIAGTTGSGKSVTIHALILALLYRNGPESMRFIMIDPKRVELTLYNNIPHLLTPVITNPKKAILALKWAAKEMDRRYDILEAEQARDIKSYHDNVYRPALEVYNKKLGDGIDEEEKARLQAELPEPMPYILIVIDELADIMSSYPRELEAAIVRLAQMSRAVGIHLVLSTQRPSTEVITGLIKANVPSRVALQVPSQIDSRTIIDMPGAEKLLGAGDMLYLSGETSKPTRLQSAYVSETEVKKVVSFINGNNEVEAPIVEITGPNQGEGASDGNFSDEASGDDDDLYEQARETVQKSGRASSSLLQRKLKVGYARGARLLDMLEERGVVGPGSGAKPREVFGSSTTATDEYAEEFDKQSDTQL
ncbi:MAG TPA: DNA translocase FtsK 4TM domain-containing protein [Candidatus Paceibacterota bacterium]